jgi:hypothetical protein
MASSRRCCCLAVDRRIEAALEMVVMKNLARTRKRRQVRRRPPQRCTYWPRRYLLTKNEAAFFRVLTTLVGDGYLVSCKVRLADLVTCGQRDWQRGHGNRVAQKHIDFVVSHADSSRIVTAIELDDRSHERPERRKRDAFVNQLFRQMDVRLIRIPASWKYDREYVAPFLRQAGITVRLEIDPGSISRKPTNLRSFDPSK